MFSTLALGFATVALALEGGDEVNTSNELIAAPSVPTGIVNEAGAPPSIDGERRRLRVTNAYIRDLLDLNLCTNNHNAISKILNDAVRDVRNGSLRPWQMRHCGWLKRAILPSLKKCVLESTGVDHTLYAGVTVDGGVGLTHAAVVGAYVDNDGLEGCFTTTCKGLGISAGFGAGGVAGVLFGNGRDDFPGVGYGGEVGGDFGYGVDFAGGATTGYRPFAELSAGWGIGFTLGVTACTTQVWN